MTFPGTDLANSAFGPYDTERAAVLRRYLAEEWAIRSVTTISLDPVDVCEVVLPAIDGMNALHGAEQARDAALTALHKVTASLTAECDKYGLPPSAAALETHLRANAAFVRAIDQSTIKLLQAERDALAAELSELRAASRAVLEPVHSTVTDEERLRKLLAKPQGGRGAQILKRRDWLLGRLMAMNTVRLSQGLLSAEFLRIWELTLNEIAEQEATNV